MTEVKWYRSLTMKPLYLRWFQTTNEQFEELKAQLVRPFKLEKGCLLRAAIYITEDRKYLFTDFHHILADGNSYDIIFEDINRAYMGEKLKKGILYWL